VQDVAALAAWRGGRNRLLVERLTSHAIAGNRLSQPAG
jgi:hypothetical protein